MAVRATLQGDIMTRCTSDQARKDKGLNIDDYSFSMGSIPGATQFKLKDVLNSEMLNKKKTVVSPESPIEKKIVPDIEKPQKKITVIRSESLCEKKIVSDTGKPHKNKTVLGGHKVSTTRAYKSDIDQVNAYLLEIKKHAYCIGYIDRCGRGNKGPQLSFTYALHYKLKGLAPEDAAREFMKERNIK